MTTNQLAEALYTMAEWLRVSTVSVGGASGTIWRSDGLIMTNAHVVRGRQTTVTLADGRVLKAKVTARDPKRDLAALQVDATDLTTVTLGNPNTLRIGELVLAVGNPVGVAGALTMGVVHSFDRERLEKPYSSQSWIVADIRLAPGNSGGLLANARGEVLGITTAIANGLALVIPSGEVEGFVRSFSA